MVVMLLSGFDYCLVESWLAALQDLVYVGELEGFGVAGQEGRVPTTWGQYWKDLVVQAKGFVTLVGH